MSEWLGMKVINIGTAFGLKLQLCQLIPYMLNFKCSVNQHEMILLLFVIPYKIVTNPTSVFEMYQNYCILLLLLFSKHACD